MGNKIYNYNSPIGEISIITEGDILREVCFVGQKYYGKIFNNKGADFTTVNAGAKALPNTILETITWLDEYFSGAVSKSTPKFKLDGTPFQMEVWKILSKIPYGKTMTYGEIAQKIAKKKGISKMSPQAVGNAVSHNPIGIIIPCHRVVGASGNLTGYAGGLDKKIALLSLEGVDMSKFYLPK